MIYPNKIHSDFFKKMIKAGWYVDREVISDLPKHILDLPSEVLKFLKEIWYLNVVDDFFFLSNFEKIEYTNVIYTFGETTHSLYDYASSDEYAIFYQEMSGRTLRNFGHKDGREVLIDQFGYIYEIPDSGDLYFIGSKYYEGLYNLIYNSGRSYRVEENGILIDEKEGNNSHLKEFK